MFTKLEQAFVRTKGPNAIQQLKALANNTHVLTIGGDQLTGKSTLCKDIAEKLQIPFISAGTVFRDIAKAEGLSVAQLSKQALSDPSIDTSIEYATCETILSGVKGAKPLVIVEGRNPAVMAKFCRDVIGKNSTSILSVYLSCSPRIQARRYIGREISRPLAFTIDSLLPAGKQYDSLHAVSVDIQALEQHPDVLSASNSASVSLDSVLAKFVDNESRDDSDRSRYMSLYGFPPELDYRNPNLYDLVIDTSNHDPTDSLLQMIQFLENHASGRNFLQMSNSTPVENHC